MAGDGHGSAASQRKRMRGLQISGAWDIPALTARRSTRPAIARYGGLHDCCQDGSWSVQPCAVCGLCGLWSWSVVCGLWSVWSVCGLCVRSVPVRLCCCVAGVQSVGCACPRRLVTPRMGRHRLAACMPRLGHATVVPAGVVVRLGRRRKGRVKHGASSRIRAY
jgi:hypothetical protein